MKNLFGKIGLLIVTAMIVLCCFTVHAQTEPSPYRDTVGGTITGTVAGGNSEVKRWKAANIHPISTCLTKPVYDTAHSLISNDTIKITRLAVYYVAEGDFVTFYWHLDYANRINENQINFTIAASGSLTVPLDDGLSMTYIEIFQYVKDNGITETGLKPIINFAE